MINRSAVLDLGNSAGFGKPNLVLHVDDESLKQWNRQIFAMIEAAGQGSHGLVEDMADTVLRESKRYVPTDTFTLYNSGYRTITAKRNTYIVPKIGSVKGYDVCIGTVGYGSNEQSGGPNPRSGIFPSVYAWKVHEDLSAKHPNGGQAKFLERAFREYVASELGPEMVQLEHTIYIAKKYTPVMHYTNKSKTFNGKRERKRRNKRESDRVTNLDRLSEVYSKTLGGR